jgi:hypothetical protein
MILEGFDLFWDTDESNIPDSWFSDPFVDYYWGTGYGSLALDPPFYKTPTQEQIDGWIDTAISAGVKDAGQALSRMVGGVPDRGDFSKYLREVYPYVWAKAKAVKKAVDVWWFGDVVRCNPDGKWGVTYKGATTNALAESFWQKAALTDNFLVMGCPHGSEDIPLGTCWFNEYGKGNTSLLQKANTTTTGGVSFATLGFASLALLVFLWYKGGFHK